MPSSDHYSTCMDALIQLKKSLKAHLIDIRNSINDFEDEVQVQRQNDKFHSLSEKSKNIIFINNYSNFLTANGVPKKRFYGDVLSITKLSFSVLAKNIKWRRNSSSINSASNPSPVNSIKLAKLVPSTSKPTNNSLISKELREAFMHLFTSLLDSNVI